MYFNVNVTGSSYTQSTGIIHVSVFNGTPPYLINYRNFDGSPFPGLKIDDGLYLGFPEYTKAINVPIGFYYVDVTDQYGAGITQTECVIVEYSGYNQLQIDNTPPEEDVVTFPCETGNCYANEECQIPSFYWITTEDGCYINLAFNSCLDNCFLIGGHCIPVDGCIVIDEVGVGIADECGWTFLNEDGNPPF
jgi:hypothetical protein